MFAAVAGKSLKTFTRYYAERGLQLGVLELLLASQTVWGTIESQMLPSLLPLESVSPWWPRILTNPDH
jgi:hypothetical protein